MLATRNDELGIVTQYERNAVHRTREMLYTIRDERNAVHSTREMLCVAVHICVCL